MNQIALSTIFNVSGRTKSVSSVLQLPNYEALKVTDT